MTLSSWIVRYGSRRAVPLSMLSGAICGSSGTLSGLSYRICGSDTALAQRWLRRLMANKTKVTPQNEEVPEKEGPETPPDSQLLDLSDAAVKTLIRSAKKRGYVTRDQINSVLPSEEVNSKQIEDVLAMFSEMGVNVVETEEATEQGQHHSTTPHETTSSGKR